MARPRPKMPDACYHTYCRVLEKAYRLTRKERDIFRNLMYQVADFSGVVIYEYTIMDNHFHIAVHVPEKKDISEEELYRRVTVLYGLKKAEKIFKKWDYWRETGQSDRVEKEQKMLLARMYDISQFMKTLLERFTSDFNHRHDRKGTLWESRFGSQLLERGNEAVLGAAAYIATNWPRATKNFEDPAKYRWSGYAEAQRGNKLARRGIMAMYGKDLDAEPEAWEEINERYTERVRRKANEVAKELGAAAITKVIREGGCLSHAQALRCRIRFFTYGVALGSKEFIERVYRSHPERFGPHYTPVPVLNLPIQGLYTATKLRKIPITLS